MTIFAENFSKDPWWWQSAPIQDNASDSFEAVADIVVVGSGFTGLSAALELAKGGKKVLVLDKGTIGEGASSRNGGMIGSGHHLTYEGLVDKYGEELAVEIIQEGHNALKFTSGLIADNNIDCDYVKSGRLRTACFADHFETMKRDHEAMVEKTGLNATVVERENLADETSADFYHGGILFHEHGGLHPAKFHRGLLTLARKAGAKIIGNCAVTNLHREAAGYTVLTPLGKIKCEHMIVATNGYIDGVFARLRRRIVPAFSYIIATEELSPNLIRSAIPNGRMMVESRSIHSYYRPSPDGKRILFGGRAALRGIDQTASAKFLYKTMVDLYPQLEGAKLTNSWRGHLGFTRDYMPHLGNLDGLYYAMGYCGSGVAMAPYLGHRIAMKVLGQEDKPSPFETVQLPGIPFYTGHPWFLPFMDVWRSIRNI